MAEAGWFRPWCSESEAAQYLDNTPAGSFVIREAAEQSYILTVQEGSAVTHVPLERGW